MAKKKEMNRTAGTAKRKISQAEEVRFGMKTGKPLTGSASGVKSISLKQAGEALTQGIVTTRGGKLQFAPEGLAMALPLGKVAKAAKALGAAGKITQAVALESRLAAKVLGKKNPFRRGLIAAQSDGNVIRALGKRRASESVFPRLPGNSIPGSARTFDKYDDPLLEGAGRFRGKDDLSAFVSDAAVLGGMRKVGKAAAKRRGR
jgi:hypothetical protein